MQFLEFDMIQYKVRNYIDNFTITFIMPFIKKYLIYIYYK